MHMTATSQRRDNWRKKAKHKKEFKLPCCQPWDLPIKIKSTEYAWFSVAHQEGEFEEACRFLLNVFFLSFK